jgi:hypothetical protein
VSARHRQVLRDALLDAEETYWQVLSGILDGIAPGDQNDIGRRDEMLAAEQGLDEGASPYPAP